MCVYVYAYVYDYVYVCMCVRVRCYASPWRHSQSTQEPLDLIQPIDATNALTTHKPHHHTITATLTAPGYKC